MTQQDQKSLDDIINIFCKSSDSLDPNKLAISLTYQRELEFQLQQQLYQLQSYSRLQQLYPSFVNVKQDASEQTGQFGLTELCLPQSDDVYDPMPKHRFERVKNALIDVVCIEDIDKIVEYCNARYLYFSCEQLKEAFMILGRQELRQRLYQLEKDKIADTENLGIVWTILQKQEVKTLQQLDQN